MKDEQIEEQAHRCYPAGSSTFAAHNRAVFKACAQWVRDRVQSDHNEALETYQRALSEAYLAQKQAEKRAREAQTEAAYFREMLDSVQGYLFDEQLTAAYAVTKQALQPEPLSGEGSGRANAEGDGHG